MKVGISIITYKRKDQLLRCVRSLLEHTPIHPDIDMSIFDDGSDYKIEVDPRFTVFQGKTNQGIATNKNRSLYYYTEINPVDVLIMIEDDMVATKNDWHKQWVDCILKYHHVNYKVPCWTEKDIVSKNTTGTWDNIHSVRHLSGQVHGILIETIRNNLGYFNPSYTGWGFEHIEWTQKLQRSSYPCFDYGLEIRQAETTRTEETFKRNEHIFKTQRSRGPVELPWVDEEQKKIFLGPFTT